MNENVTIELNMLKARYPGKMELTYDEYADYFGISRHHASQHFKARRKEIPHKQIGKKVIIPMVDFAFWLAQQKVVNGKPILLTQADKKRQRGFCQPN